MEIFVHHEQSAHTMKFKHNSAIFFSNASLRVNESYIYEILTFFRRVVRWPRVKSKKNPPFCQHYTAELHELHGFTFFHFLGATCIDHAIVYSLITGRCLGRQLNLPQLSFDCSSQKFQPVKHFCLQINHVCRIPLVE